MKWDQQYFYILYRQIRKSRNKRRNPYQKEIDKINLFLGRKALITLIILYMEAKTKMTINAETGEIAGNGTFEERSILTKAAFVKNLIDENVDINEIKDSDKIKDDKEISIYADEYLKLKESIG